MLFQKTEHCDAFYSPGGRERIWSISLVDILAGPTDPIDPLEADHFGGQPPDLTPRTTRGR